MKRNNFALWLIVMILIVVIGGAVYSFTDTTALLQDQKKNGDSLLAGFSKRVVDVVADKVERQNIAVTIGSLGTITASESSEIHAPVSGRVDEIGFQEGQSVKEGDMLLEIDSAALHIEMDKARADLQLAQAALDQGDETAGLKREQAQAIIDSINARMEQAQIKAPFDGVVGLRNFSIGNMVQVGQILTNIDATDPMNISFSIPEKNFADIHEGQEVAFTVDTYPELFFKGEIYAIDSRIDPKKRSFNVKAMVANTESKLRTGMYARLQIPTIVHSNAITVPDYALLTKKTPQEEKNYVFVLDKGRALRTEVKTGIRQNGMVEILEGLNEDQIIAATNIPLLRNKTRVNIIEQEENTPDEATENTEETAD